MWDIVLPFVPQLGNTWHRTFSSHSADITVNVYLHLKRERETFSLFSAQPPYSLFLNFIHLRIKILRSMYVCIFGKSLLSTGMTGLYV